MNTLDDSIRRTRGSMRREPPRARTFTIFSFRRFNGTFNDRSFCRHTGGEADGSVAMVVDPRVLSSYI